MDNQNYWNGKERRDTTELETLRARVAALDSLTAFQQRTSEDILEQLAASQAENARLREALINFSKVAPQVVSCNDFHHVKKDRHEFDQPCPVTARYFAALEAVTQALAGESK